MFLHNCYKNIDDTPQEQVPTSPHTSIYKKDIGISYRKLRVFGLTQLHRILHNAKLQNTSQRTNKRLFAFIFWQNKKQLYPQGTRPLHIKKTRLQQYLPSIESVGKMFQKT